VVKGDRNKIKINNKEREEEKDDMKKLREVNRTRNIGSTHREQMKWMERRKTRKDR
jgi:hypothetical protein